MNVLFQKLEVQRWSALFWQGDVQRHFVKTKMQMFYGRGEAHGSKLSTMVRGTAIVLTAADVSHILRILNVGWDHYVRHECPL